VEIAKRVEDQLEVGIHGMVVVDFVVPQDLAPNTNLLALSFPITSQNSLIRIQSDHTTSEEGRSRV
jgi:hypothetical protein